MTFTVLLGNQAVTEPMVSTFTEIYEIVHIDDLLSLLKDRDGKYRHIYVSNVSPAATTTAAGSGSRVFDKSMYLHMHYKPTCPYTRQALYLIERFDKPLVVAMHNAEHPDRRTKLEAYLAHTKGFDGSSRLTFPQFFFDGQPLGGSDTFMDHADMIVNKVQKFGRSYRKRVYTRKH